MKKLPEVTVTLRVGGKSIALVPTGIRALPYLNTLELMAVLFWFASCRWAMYWWIGDIFANNKQYAQVPYSFIRVLYKNAAVGISTIILNIRACRYVPIDKRRNDISTLKQYALWTMDNKELAAELVDKAAEEKWNLAKVVYERLKYPPDRVAWSIRRRAGINV